MKNKKSSTVQFLAFLLLSLGLIFAGCSGGGSNENSAEGGTSGGNKGLAYQGSTAPLNHLYFIDWGSYGDVYSLDIYITSVDLKPDNFPPQEGRYIYLEMYFPNASVAPGTYPWSNADPPLADTFSDYSGITVVVNGDESWHELTGGTVTIEQNGSTYTIIGNVTTVHGPATFAYDGQVTAKWKSDSSKSRE